MKLACHFSWQIQSNALHYTQKIFFAQNSTFGSHWITTSSQNHFEPHKATSQPVASQTHNTPSHCKPQQVTAHHMSAHQTTWHCITWHDATQWSMVNPVCPIRQPVSSTMEKMWNNLIYTSSLAQMWKFRAYWGPQILIHGKYLPRRWVLQAAKVCRDAVPNHDSGDQPLSAHKRSNANPLGPPVIWQRCKT